jgi:hypothetical protein
MELAQQKATQLELAQQAATRRELANQLTRHIASRREAERRKETCEDEMNSTCDDECEHFRSMNSNTQKAKPTNTFYTMLSSYFKDW